MNLKKKKKYIKTRLRAKFTIKIIKLHIRGFNMLYTRLFSCLPSEDSLNTLSVLNTVKLLNCMKSYNYNAWFKHYWNHLFHSVPKKNPCIDPEFANKNLFFLNYMKKFKFSHIFQTHGEKNILAFHRLHVLQYYIFTAITWIKYWVTSVTATDLKILKVVCVNRLLFSKKISQTNK